MGRTVPAITVLALLALSCDNLPISVNRTETPKEPVTVKVMAAAGASAKSSTVYVGSIEPSKSTTLAAANSGTLSVLNVKQGDKVRKGQEIAKVESQTIRSSYDMACASLKRAEDAYERVSKVYSSGSVAEVKMVEVETALENARATKAAAEKALWHCTLVAPFDGVVGDVYASRGVELNFASPVASIIDLSKVEIHFPVPENEFSRIKIGDQIRYEIPAVGLCAEAKITSRAAIASPLSHSYDYTVGNIPGNDLIMPGMVCKVYVERNSENGTVIPSGAVRTDMEGRYVWVVSDDTVYKRRIEVGGYSGTGIIVREGLSPEDRVIIEGARKISGGMKVKAVE